MTRMLIAQLWHFSLEINCTFCTLFRRNRNEALRRRSGMSNSSNSGTKKQRIWPVMKKKKIKFEEGSGNIFADLGLKDSDELFARAQIGFCVYKIVNDQNLKQREIGAVLEAADFFVVGAKQAND